VILVAALLIAVTWAVVVDDGVSCLLPLVIGFFVNLAGNASGFTSESDSFLASATAFLFFMAADFVVPAAVVF